MSTWQFITTQGQGHSLIFVQGHSDSTFSKFFFSERARLIEAKFHIEPPWDVGRENLFKCSIPKYGKKLKKNFFGTKRSMTLKLCIQHRVHEYYQFLQMMACVDLDNFYDSVNFVS